jgi:DNA-binding NarL/FixJ family response regulator
MARSGNEGHDSVAGFDRRCQVVRRKEFRVSNAPDSTTVRVALIEDHPVYMAGLSAALHLAGCTVETEAAAVEALEELQPLPEVVVCDLHLPGRSGPEAIGYLVDLGCEVLATSGVAKPEEVLDAVGAGAHAFLDKRAAPQAFARAVAALANGEYHVSPELAGYLLDDAARRPLPRGDLSATAIAVLGAFARGDTDGEVQEQFSLAPEALVGLLGQVWEAARRRRLRYAPSPREREVLIAVRQGLSHKEIAARLGISSAWLSDLLEHLRDKYVALHPEGNPAIAPLAAAHRWAVDLGIE